MNEDKKSSVGVIGAGIQGVCTSIFLVKKGFKVTLIDRDEPGNKSASYGNAGHFSHYAILQLNRPDILLDVPTMLFSSRGPLSLKWNHIPKMIPWIVRYIRNCNQNSMLRTAKYMHQILNLSIPTYDEILSEIDTKNLIEKKGIIYIWTNKNIKSRELEIKIRKDFGIEQKILSPKEIHDLEPNISQVYDGGVLYPGATHTRDPGRILLKLFELFLKKGGKFRKKDVRKINFDEKKKILVKTNEDEHVFNKLVIACGAYSKILTDQLNENIPLDTERGYHVHFKNMDHLINRPIIFLDKGFGLTPMDQGLRAVGTVELGGLKNPLSKKRIENIVLNAKELLPQLGNHCDEWMGFRPTLPDFLPVIGPSKINKNIFYAFGHHHLGWTLGPITGKIVAGLIADEKTNLDLAPYSPIRFV